MKKIYLLSFLICPLIFGQTYKQYKTIDELTIPSPNSSSLGQYGNIDLNGNTGAISLDVPLKTLNFYELQLPINISYYSQGLRPMEESSRFGLGWTGSFEPVITRKINGIDDLNITIYERNQVGYVYTDEAIPDYGFSIGDSQQQSGIPFIDKLYLHNPKTLKSATVGWDTEQDDFTLNIFGETVSFVLSQKKLTDNKIIAQYISNDKNYKIEYQEDNQTFKVINDKGYTFQFTEKEYSITASEGQYRNHSVTESTRNKIITTWKLSKIIAPNKEEVNYTYTRGITQSVVNESNIKYHNPCRRAKFPSFIFGGSYNRSSSINGFSNLELTKIESIFFTVDIIGGQRADIIGLGETPYPTTNMSGFLPNSPSISTKIDNIIIRDKSNNEINNFNFLNSYYNADKLNNTYSKHFLRLKLDRIEKDGESYYRFNYKDTDKLPEKVNNSTDFWGFYNGKTNPYLYPSYSQDAISGCALLIGDVTASDPINIDGDEKKPDYLKSQIGTLQSVVYPTKGYSEFVTEANDIVISKDNEKKLNLSNYGIKTYDEVITESDSEDYPVTKIIEITENNTVVKFNINLGCAGNYEFTPQRHQKCDIEYKDKDKLAYSLINLSNNNIIFQGKYYDNVIPYSNTILTETATLPIGRYQLLTQGFKHISNFFDEQEGIHRDQNHPDYGKQYNYRIKTSIQLPKLSFAKEYNLEVGGIRVKEIVNYDYDNKLLNRKKYEYLNSNSFSSGVLSDPLRFHQFINTSFRDYPPSITNWSDDTLLQVFNTSILDSPSKSFMGYKRIIEKNVIGNTDNGKKISFYNHDTNEYENKYNMGLQMIFIRGTDTNVYSNLTLATYPRTSFEFSNGRLLKQEFYNVHKKIKEKIMYYDYPYNQQNFALDDVASINIKMDMRTSYDYTGFNIVNTNANFDILQIYRRIRNNPMLIKTIDTDFFENSNDSISSTTNYSYNRFQLTKQSSKNSKGETLTTEYQYPPDLTSSYAESSKMTRLVNENRIAEPVITKQQVGSVYVSEVHNQYNEFYGILQKSAVFQKKGSSIDLNVTTDRKIVYNSYDAKGNITQYTPENGIPVAIIWGYNGQYPIAKIEGASYSTVEQYVSALQTASNNGSLTKDSFNSLRTALPNAMVTTYVYKPLVGVTTITAPNGISEFYKYDNANRLQEIKNDEGEVLKTFQYNYKN